MSGSPTPELTLRLVLLAVFLIYGASLLTGFRLAKRGRIDRNWLLRTRRRLADPLTARLGRWHDRVKLESLKQKRWLALWLVISFNNLVLVAGVSRVLYGFLVVLPLYVTIRTGLGHGILRAQEVRGPRGARIIGLLELGGYFLATVLGINVALQLVVGGLPGFKVALFQCAIGFAVVAAMVLFGSLLEVLTLKAASPEFDIPPDVDMNEVRARALRALQAKSDLPGRETTR
jgi:hypothetical protein